MKRLLLLCLLVLALLALAAPSWADFTNNFDACTKNAYAGIVVCQGFVFYDNTGLYSGTTDARGGSGKAVRINKVAGARIAMVGGAAPDTVGKHGGLGTFDFWYKTYSTYTDAEIKVVTTVAGVTVDSVNVHSYNNTWNHFTRTINNASDNIRVTLTWVSGERFNVDDFSVTDYSTPAGETDAHVTVAGIGAQPSISSLVTSESQIQTVMTFGLQDVGTGTMNTIITSVVIGQGAGNQATNWTQYIAEARLTDGTNTWIGQVNTGDITFFTPLAMLPNGGAQQIWTLKLWLKTNLPYNADNKVLEFRVGPTSFVTDASGSSFNASDAVVSSGATNNRIDIVATRLSITTQPPAIAFVNSNFTTRAGFTDIYGGIDADFNEQVTLAVANGTGTLNAVSGLTKLSTNGESAWTDLQYNTTEAGVVLQATSPTYTTPALTNAITVTTPPSIVMDAYPTCWDKDTTANAMAFAVHITISNWLAMANHPVYVKVFNSTLGNPYHYTAQYGWTKDTYWDHKPTVTLDANGNWAGWLALKSYGIGGIKPRAADVSNTATYITGAQVDGTLLDLSGTGNGAVLEDRDGSTHSTPGDIILVRNGTTHTIVGSWIVEDNGYPQDNGAGDMASGGWRVALCAFCDAHVIFETYHPQDWPGHGNPSSASEETNFCIYPGESVEITDVILPVELLGTPEAVAGDGSVTLNWSTASENGNARFDIVRNNQVVGRVNGAGTSPTHHSYKWTESGLTNGTTYSYTLRAVATDGSTADLATVNATPTANAAVITEYALHQNYPNPFNPTTSIAVDLVESGNVSLKVYNLMGQEVASLVNGNLGAGRHIVNFDASHLSSGIYLYRLNVNGFSAEKKMLLMK